jgi:hypothetical protein
MQRFHRPEDEKRMVVILRPEHYGEWLSCSVAEAPGFFQRLEGPLDALADPLPPRVSWSNFERHLDRDFSQNEDERA